MSKQPQTINDNTITGLRTIMFDTLRGLGNKTVDVEQAKAISNLSQAIINSVKAEIDFAKVTGLNPQSEFIPALPAPESKPSPQTQNGSNITHPAPGVTRHILK